MPLVALDIIVVNIEGAWRTMHDVARQDLLHVAKRAADVKPLQGRPVLVEYGDCHEVLRSEINADKLIQLTMDSNQVIIPGQ